MNNLSKLQSRSILKWGFVKLIESSHTPSKTAIGATGFNHITQNPRFYSRKASVQSRNCQKPNCLSMENNALAHREAQDALIEYLHSTRSLQYLDAENISRNSPKFLEKLLKDVANEIDAKQALRRLLCYHPINEFEPFFESMGLKPSECSLLLRRNMIYLSDDERLLENYHVLCEYGIAPNKIGKIYMDVQDVFRYENDHLLSKLQSLQEMGFDQSSVVKLVASCSNLLINNEFSKVLEELTNIGIVTNWFVENITEEDSYIWSQILVILCLLKKIGFRNGDLRDLLIKNPAVLLEDSGAKTVSLIVFLIKFGASYDDILSLFLEFPQIEIQRSISIARRK